MRITRTRSARNHNASPKQPARSRSHRGALLVATLALSTATACTIGRPVTMERLLHEMTDLASLARLPVPAYDVAQASSFDRRQLADNARYANEDFGHYLSTEQRDGRTEYVLFEAPGPGAIVRIWSANPKGTLRVYLDRGSRPVLEVPAADFLSGKTDLVPRPIVGNRGRGSVSYLPIPFRAHCKITVDAPDLYYHVTHRRYIPQADVRTLRRNDLQRLTPALLATANRLNRPYDQALQPAWLLHGRELPAGTRIEPGDAIRWTTQAPGPGAIVGLRMRVAEADGDDAPLRSQTLRTLLLRMRFDGEETVVSPLGDFFGAAPGTPPFEALPCGITEQRVLWCQWVMPFQRNAEILIENRGDAPVEVSYAVAGTEYAWGPDSLHFHAKWHANRDVPTRPLRAWKWGELFGRGHLVGAALSVANPVRQWWGEGDETVLIDLDPQPRFRGTGTDHFFNIGWGTAEPFSHAYYAQPRRDGPDSFGFTALNRWFVMDRVSFSSRLRFDAELWHLADTTLSQSVVLYWYARPGGSDDFKAPRAAELTLPRLPAQPPE